MTRLARTSASFIPLLGLGAFYLQAARRNGPMRPVWENLSNPWSPYAWGARLWWVDPITLAIKNGLPFTSLVSPGFAVFAPVLWLGLSMVLWWYGRISNEPRAHAPIAADDPDGRKTFAEAATGDDRNGWLLLAALLIAVGIRGTGLVWRGPRRIPSAAGGPTGLDCARAGFRRGSIAMARPGARRGACGGASLCNRRSSGITGFIPAELRGRSSVFVMWSGRGQRIVTLLVRSRSRFRANPLLHAEDWLGVDSGNVVWNNYEALHYYFPVQFKPEIERPHPGDLELVSIHEEPKDKSTRLGDWERILSRHADSIDVILFWKSDEALEAITKRWFDLTERKGDVQIFRRSQARRCTLSGGSIRASPSVAHDPDQPRTLFRQ